MDDDVVSDSRSFEARRFRLRAAGISEGGFLIPVFNFVDLNGLEEKFLQ